MIQMMISRKRVSVNEKNKKIRINLTQKIIVGFLIILMMVFELADFQLFENAKDTSMVTNSILRFLGGIIFIVMIVAFGYRRIFKFRNLKKSLLIVIPALIISINNFPIIAFFDGRAVLTEPVYRVFLFFIECLSIGFFEEIIFRGIILLFLVKRFSHERHGVLLSIVLSSALFGYFHFFNILSGASLGDTVLQVGYSFLVGMMWAVMYLKTGNLWLTMILHASYNFFGQVMFYLGAVQGRYDVYTVIITSVFAIMVAIYSIIIYKRLDHQTLILA
jgi:membrane protease YdiL (CAAX protease family)